MREYNSINYYRLREKRVRELAEAAEDAAISSNYLKMAACYSDLIAQLATLAQQRSTRS